MSQKFDLELNKADKIKTKLHEIATKKSQFITNLRQKVHEDQYNDIVLTEQQKRAIQEKQEKLEREKALKRREFLKMKVKEYDQSFKRGRQQI